MSVQYSTVHVRHNDQCTDVITVQLVKQFVAAETVILANFQRYEIKDLYRCAARKYSTLYWPFWLLARGYCFCRTPVYVYAFNLLLSVHIR